MAEAIHRCARLLVQHEKGPLPVLAALLRLSVGVFAEPKPLLRLCVRGTKMAASVVRRAHDSEKHVPV